MPFGFKGNILTTSSAFDGLITQGATVTNNNMESSGQTNKFGGAALQCKISNQWLQIDINSPAGGFEFKGSQAFTLEFWVNINWASNLNYERELFRFATTTNANNRIKLTSSLGINFYSANNSPQSATNLSQGTWSHLALVCRGNNTFDGYVDGTRYVTGASFSTSGTKRFFIGGIGGDIIGSNLNSYYDELRISNTERYTGSSFSVPTSQFTTDENTVTLFHWNFVAEGFLYDYAVD